MWVIEQFEASWTRKVATENKRNASDVEECEKTQVVRVGERRVVDVRRVSSRT